jgi:hypothetical protein
MAVISLDDRDDLLALGRVSRRLQRNLDSLGAAGAEDRVFHVRRGLNQLLGKSRTRNGREPVVAHVKIIEAGLQHLHQLGMAVPEIVGSAVKVQIDQAFARHVVKEIAFPPVDDHRRSGFRPEIDLARVPELGRFPEELLLGVKGEISVIEHALPL